MTRRCGQHQAATNKRLAHQGLNVGHRSLVIRGHQGDGLAGGTRATRAADAMDVVFSGTRHIKIDHCRELGDIEAAGRNIGGHQDLNLASFETLKRGEAIALGLVTMDGIGCNALSNELTGQAPRTNLGVGKDKHLL